MIFHPQRYAIPDEPMKPFIDDAEIFRILENADPSPGKVSQVIARSLGKNRLTLEETAILIKAADPQINAIREGAERLKKEIYGERIVLFAPLYVGNFCINNCKYCGFRSSNKKALRRTLSREELVSNVKALEDDGQKRLILVYGEHPSYSPGYIAETVKTVYEVKNKHGEIRRVNINAAPLDVEGFRTVKEAGIGTYQVFQETYHRETYRRYHTGGMKKDYDYRLTALDRAQEAGLDDVGIGALFGLYDWKYEVMALLRHVNHLEACYHAGPHTISFPRLQYASEYDIDDRYLMSDEEFTRMVAILRLAVPYTGLILTAREPEKIRREALRYGVSQIDAGTKLEIGAYADQDPHAQDPEKEQFLINDNRSLREVIDELLEEGYIPSFCTACYRRGRTGEHFMEFSVPGFIKRYCTPNALLTLAEYLEDYAPENTRQKGHALIEKKLAGEIGPKSAVEVRKRLERIRAGERDLYF